MGGAQVGESYCCRIEGFLGYTHVYGNETATKFQNILKKKKDPFSIAPSSLAL
jgi:hypothetical protein